MQKFQVALLGLNSLFGRMSSYLLKRSNIVKKLSLYDEHNIESAKDIAIINTTCRVEAFLGKEQLNDAVKDADVVIIGDENLSTPHTAFDLMAPKMCDYAKAVASSSPNAIILVAASPMNVLVPLLSEAMMDCGCYDCNKIIGATAVDNMRASCILADHLKVNPQKLVLPVVGGSSKETRVPLLSQAKPTLSFTSLQDDAWRDIVIQIKEADSEIFALKKSPEALNKAYTTVRFLNTIFAGLRGETNNISIAFSRTSQIPNVDYFSLPVQFGRFGIQQRFGLPKILPFEKDLINESVFYLNKDVDQAKQFFKTKESAIELCSRNVSQTNYKKSEFEYFNSTSMKELGKIEESPSNDLVLNKNKLSNSKLYKSLSSSRPNIMAKPWDKPFDIKSFFFKHVGQISASESSVNENSKSLLPLNLSEIFGFGNEKKKEAESESEYILTVSKPFTGLDDPVKLIPNYSPRGLLLDTILNNTSGRFINENKMEETHSLGQLFDKSSSGSEGNAPNQNIRISTVLSDKQKQMVHNVECKHNIDGKETKSKMNPKEAQQTSSYLTFKEKSCKSKNNFKENKVVNKPQVIPKQRGELNVSSYKNSFPETIFNKNAATNKILLEKESYKRKCFKKSNHENEFTSLVKGIVPHSRDSVTKGRSPTYNLLLKKKLENNLKNQISLENLQENFASRDSKKNTGIQDCHSGTNAKFNRFEVNNASSTQRKTFNENITKDSVHKNKIIKSEDYCSIFSSVNDDNGTKKNCKKLCSDNKIFEKHCTSDKRPKFQEATSSGTTKNNSLFKVNEEPTQSEQTKIIKQNEKVNLNRKKLFFKEEMISNSVAFKDKMLNSKNSVLKPQCIFYGMKDLNTNTKAVRDWYSSSYQTQSSNDPFEESMKRLNEEVFSDGIIECHESNDTNNSSSTIQNDQKKITEDSLDESKEVLESNVNTLTMRSEEVKPEQSSLMSNEICSEKSNNDAIGGSDTSFRGGGGNPFKEESEEGKEKKYSIFPVDVKPKYIQPEIIEESEKCPLYSSEAEPAKPLRNIASSKEEISYESNKLGTNSDSSILSKNNSFQKRLHKKSKSPDFLLNLKEKLLNEQAYSNVNQNVKSNSLAHIHGSKMIPQQLYWISKNIPQSNTQSNFVKCQKKNVNRKISFSQEENYPKQKVHSSTKNLQLNVHNESKIPRSNTVLGKIKNCSKPKSSLGKIERGKQNSIKNNKSVSDLFPKGAQCKKYKREILTHEQKVKGRNTSLHRSLPRVSFSNENVPKLSKSSTATKRNQQFKDEIPPRQNQVGRNDLTKSRNYSRKEKNKTNIDNPSKKNHALYRSNIDAMSNYEEQSINVSSNLNISEFRPISPSRSFINKMKSKFSKTNTLLKTPDVKKKHKNPAIPKPQNLLKVIQQKFEKKTAPAKLLEERRIQLKDIASQNSIRNQPSSEESSSNSFFDNRRNELQIRDLFLDRLVANSSIQFCHSSKCDVSDTGPLSNEIIGNMNTDEKVRNSVVKRESKPTELKFFPLKMGNERQIRPQDYVSTDLGASACSYLLREKLQKLNAKPVFQLCLTEPMESHATFPQSKVCEDFPASSSIGNLYSQFTKDFIGVENSRTQKLPSLSFLQSHNWSI